MSKPFPLHPKHPERICWGCDRYCAVSSLDCGNGSERTMHPAETFGEDWHESAEWGLALDADAAKHVQAAKLQSLD
jgi:hypothetical protein